MTASSTLRGEDSAPLARLTETITRLTPNFIRDTPRVNKTQQPCPQRVPNRQGQGPNVNNVRVQTEPKTGGFGPPLQRHQPNENNF